MRSYLIKLPIILTFVVSGCLMKEKFCSSGRKCVFLGYLYGKKGWKFFNLDTPDFLCSWDVVFLENTFPYLRDIPSTSPPTLAYNFGYLHTSSRSRNTTEKGSPQPLGDISLSSTALDVDGLPLITRPNSAQPALHQPSAQLPHKIFGTSLVQLAKGH